ncbi:MAG TPA: leucyl aminopeptidase, partial [Ruegeria sp.]|nr:leucyl aminopeptidase [Ruegeria sp.]
MLERSQMPLSFAPADADALPLHVIEKTALDGWLQGQPASVAAWVRASGFTGAIGQALPVPGETGAPVMALAGYGSAETRARKRFVLAAAAESLPEGIWRIGSGLPE